MLCLVSFLTTIFFWGWYIDISASVSNVVGAIEAYADILALEARKASMYLGSIDRARVPSQRMGQILGICDDLVLRMQRLVRYAWIVEKEWNEYIGPHSVVVAGKTANSKEHGGHASTSTMFPAGYLQILGEWQKRLASGVECLRTQNRESKDEGHAPPRSTVWSAGYFLEKAKTSHFQGNQQHSLDGWLDGIPSVMTGIPPGDQTQLYVIDVRRRNVLHYAALDKGDLLWLKRFNHLDQQTFSKTTAALSTLDLAGESPLIAAARNGNAPAVLYMLNDSGVEPGGHNVAAASLAAAANGHVECVEALAKQISNGPAESAATVLAMSVFYGFKGLFDQVCHSLDGDQKANVGLAVEQQVQRSCGGCNLVHLLIMGEQVEMLGSEQHWQSMGWAGLDVNALDNSAFMSPLDMANYLGLRASADALLVMGAVERQVPGNQAALAESAIAETAVVVPPETYAVFVTVGSNDIRRPAAVTVDNEELACALEQANVARSARVALRIGSGEAVEVRHSGDSWIADIEQLVAATQMPVDTRKWHAPAHFHTTQPDHMVLNVELVAIVEDVSVVAARAAVALPDWRALSSVPLPNHTAACDYMRVVLVSPKGSVVAEAALEVVVAAPYAGNVTGSGGKWLQYGKPTQAWGHRGSGMNAAVGVTYDANYLRLSENSTRSLVNAAQRGAAAVEFDVQMTRDLVPVLYHDWTMSETTLPVPVNSLSLSRFLEIGPSKPKQTHARSPSFSASPDTRISSTIVQEPFATLEDAFVAVPSDVIFDIEVKYPMPDEADEAGMGSVFEINVFVDRILDVVLRHVSSAVSNARKVVFTSFHPDICLLLAHKLAGAIPVMFLTDAGISAMADPRCNSIDAAVRLCKWAGLAGLVSHVGPVTQSPRLASLVHSHGLVLSTYGSLNNSSEFVQLQRDSQVDIVIVDDVAGACAALATD